MGDPISAAIEAAVANAIEAQLPRIIEAVRGAVAVPSVTYESFVPMSEASRRLGMTPSTVWRLERQGKLPSREKIGGRVGYRQSTLDGILAGASTEPIPPPASAIKKGERRGGRAAAPSSQQAGRCSRGRRRESTPPHLAGGGQ